MTEEKNKYMAKQLAEALLVMRKRLNPEQEEICEKTGVSRSILSAAERGKRQLYWNPFLILMILLENNEKRRDIFSAYDIFRFVQKGQQGSF